MPACCGARVVGGHRARAVRPRLSSRDANEMLKDHVESPISAEADALLGHKDRSDELPDPVLGTTAAMSGACGSPPRARRCRSQCEAVVIAIIDAVGAQPSSRPRGTYCVRWVIPGAVPAVVPPARDVLRPMGYSRRRASCRPARAGRTASDGLFPAPCSEELATALAEVQSTVFSPASPSRRTPLCRCRRSGWIAPARALS